MEELRLYLTILEICKYYGIGVLVTGYLYNTLVVDIKVQKIIGVPFQFFFIQIY